MPTPGPWTQREVRDALILSVMGHQKSNGDVGYALIFFIKQGMIPMIDGQLFNKNVMYSVKRRPPLFGDERLRICKHTMKVVCHTWQFNLNTVHNAGVRKPCMFFGPRLNGLHGAK